MINSRSSLDRVSGLLILSSITLALIAANSPLSGFYAAVHHAPVRVGLGTFQIDESLIVWIKQGLMTLFFLLVGVQIKYKLLDRHLSSLRRAVLHEITALGGMVVAALIYVTFTASDPEAARDWAIPLATDIALALALLSLLGSHAPVHLKVFLMALAILDDLAAVAIFAALAMSARVWCRGFSQFQNTGLQTVPLPEELV